MSHRNIQLVLNVVDSANKFRCIYAWDKELTDAECVNEQWWRRDVELVQIPVGVVLAHLQ